MADRSVVVRLTAEVAGYMSSMSAAAKATKDFDATAAAAATASTRYTDRQLAAQEKFVAAQSRHAQAVQNFGRDSLQARSAQMDLADATKRVEASLGGQREAWDKVGKAMLLGGGLVALGVGEAIKAAAEFDHQMSVVQANIDDKSAPSMKRLADAALLAGHSTMFSATQAAEAENELAKAGISSADIVGGALTAALSLASAGQLNLADAAEYTASTMVQFNLHAKDTGHIADVLAAAADKSLGGVSDIAEALKYAGVTASQFHISLNETVGVLAEFASNGLLGSMAGTGVREMLVRLVKPTSDAKAAIKDLGLEFFDSHGKFLGLANMAGQLHDKLANLTDQQRQQTLVTLFGQRAMAEGNILYRDGAAGVEKWTSAVNDQGFAALQASTKMNNLQGDLTKLKNSLNAAFIETGQHGQGPLRTLTQDATGFVHIVGEIPGPVQQAALALGVVTAGSLLLGGTVGMTTTRIGALKTALTTMGVEAGSAGSALKFAGAAAAAVAVGVPLIHSLSEALSGDKALGNNTAAAQIVSNTGAIGDGFAHLGDTLHRALSDDTLSKVRRAGLDWNFLPDDSTRAVHWLQSMDAGLSQLAQSGHADEAKAKFKQITTEAARQGIALSTVTDAMPQWGAEVHALDEANKSLASSLTKASQGMNAATQDADATGSAMALLGQGASAADQEVKDLAKSIQSEMDAASKAFMKDMDVLGNYQPAKADGKVGAAQDTLNKALENLQYTRDRIGAKGQLTVAQQQQLGKAETAVHNSVSKSATARAKAEQHLSDLQARLAAKGAATPSSNHALEVANDAVAKAQRGLAAAKAADGSLSSMYAAAIAKGQKFTQDINAVMAKGLDPQVVSKLLQEGPTLAAPVLQQLLGSNSSSLIKMVNTSEEQIRHLNSIVVEQARLTAMAVKSGTDTMTSELGSAMGIAQMKALSKNGITAQDIAKKMHMTPEQATQIAKDFGIGLQKSPPPPVPIQVNVDGAHRKLDLFERDLQTFAGKTWTTYIDVQPGAAAQTGAPKSSWQQLYGVNPQAGLSNSAMQQLLGGGATTHTVTNNSPINIGTVTGPTLDDIQRQAGQRARLQGLSRNQVP